VGKDSRRVEIPLQENKNKSQIFSYTKLKQTNKQRKVNKILGIKVLGTKKNEINGSPQSRLKRNSN